MGADYARIQAEFEAEFSTGQACGEYLSWLRRPGGFTRPHCRGRKDWEDARDRLIGRACGGQPSVTRGMIFHGSRKPLRQWFPAA